MNIAPTRFLSFLVKGQLAHKGKGGKECQILANFQGSPVLEGIVREGATVCLISLCSILGLVGIKVKFQVSSTFRFQMFWCLHACSQQISSEGGLPPIKTTQECVSGFYIFQGTRSSMWQIYIYIHQWNRDNFLFL